MPTMMRFTVFFLRTGERSIVKMIPIDPHMDRNAENFGKIARAILSGGDPIVVVSCVSCCGHTHAKM
eukprot:2563498-Ditylum_brightwellii.AAC.1